MKKAVTFRVTVDTDKHTATAERAGCKCPLAMVFDDGPESVAGVYRALAFYALEIAHGLAYSADFVPPVFSNSEARKTAEIMLKEHPDIFLEAI